MRDQATCPHVDSGYGYGYDDDEWTCWDCGAYCDHGDGSDPDCERSHHA